MERAEAEGKLTAKLMDMVEILHKYDDESDYLSITWNGEEKFINIHNDAFKKDVKPINLCTDAPTTKEHAKKFAREVLKEYVEPKITECELPKIFELSDIDGAHQATKSLVLIAIRKQLGKENAKLFDQFLDLYVKCLKTLLTEANKT